MSLPKEKENLVQLMIKEYKDQEEVITNNILCDQIELDKLRNRRAILQEYLEIKMDQP